MEFGSRLEFLSLKFETLFYSFPNLSFKCYVPLFTLQIRTYIRRRTYYSGDYDSPHSNSLVCLDGRRKTNTPSEPQRRRFGLVFVRVVDETRVHESYLNNVPPSVFFLVLTNQSTNLHLEDSSIFTF